MINTKLKIEVWAIDKIFPYENNVKKHPPEQVEKIANAIKAAGGWDQPIVVDKDGVVIKGHGRRLAAIKLGLDKVPVIVRSDLTEEQIKAARLADNQAAISDIDSELLRLELADINIDLLKGIFDDKELNFTMSDLGTMNESVFISDLDAEVVKQKEKTEEQIAEAKASRIPIKKAIGFDSIPGAEEIYVSRFMARIESQSGLKGEEAFLQFVKSVIL